MIGDHGGFAPFVLMEYDHQPGRYCLMLGDGEMEQVEDVFEAHGVEANGHGWDGLAEWIVRSRLPQDADRLDFDSEAGTFVVNSSDLDALRRLAAILWRAFRDRALLDQLITAAGPELD